jgi:zinc transport system substrate-binding protein
MNQSTTAFFRVILLFFGVFFTHNNLLKAAEQTPLNIYVVNYPLKYFTQTIADQHATVTLPIPSDIDPAFWSPEPEDILKIQQADLILLNGANYAKWLPKVSLPIFKLVDTSSAFKDDYIVIKSAITHQHGTGGKHSHTGTAFTTWLDFSQAAKQAESVYEALQKKRPEQKSEFEKKFNSLQAALLDLDADMTQIGRHLNQKPILGSHPIYQYLKRRYKLNLKSVHWEPNEIPSEEQWNNLLAIIKSHPAKLMLWEAKPLPETISKLEELDIKSIIYSPSANQPKTGDFMSIMRENIERLDKNTK